MMLPMNTKLQNTKNVNKDGSMMRAVSTGAGVMFVPDVLDVKGGKKKPVSYKDLAGPAAKEQKNEHPLTAFARFGGMIKRALKSRKAA